MRNTLAVMACLALGACHRAAADLVPPPAAYVHLNDKVAAQMMRWGIPWRVPCESIHSDDRCFNFTEPEHLRGFWRNDFESSQFCLAAAEQCQPENRAKFVWLEFASPLAGRDDTPPGGLYAIDFIGRRSKYGGLFGGQALAKNEVIVDRILLIKVIDPPSPGQMTKEHVEAYLKECGGTEICMPNTEVTRNK
jgi:hypothetical protein